jgi:hypothetical protein
LSEILGLGIPQANQRRNLGRASVFGVKFRTARTVISFFFNMITKNLPVRTSIAFGSLAICATHSDAAISYQGLNLTSSAAYQGIGFGFNPITFVISNTGEQVGAVMARSAYYPGKGFSGQSYINGDYNGGSNQAQISMISLAADTVISSSLDWNARVYVPQGLSDSYYGIRFNQGAGDYNYGWVKMNTQGNDVNFISAGVETVPNTSILAGATTAVPEVSSSLLTLAGGAAALMGIRRRKVA